MVRFSTNFLSQGKALVKGNHHSFWLIWLKMCALDWESYIDLQSLRQRKFYKHYPLTLGATKPSEKHCRYKFSELYGIIHFIHFYSWLNIHAGLSCTQFSTFSEQWKQKEECIQSIQMQTTHSFAVKYPFLWWLCSFAMLTCCGVIFIVISFPANGRIHYSQQFYDFKNSTASTKIKKTNQIKSCIGTALGKNSFFSFFLYFSVFNSGN